MIGLEAFLLVPRPLLLLQRPFYYLEPHLKHPPKPKAKIL